MKITESKLRQIIREVIAESSDYLKDLMAPRIKKALQTL